MNERISIFTGAFVIIILIIASKSCDTERNEIAKQRMQLDAQQKMECLKHNNPLLCGMPYTRSLCDTDTDTKDKKCTVEEFNK